MKTIRLAPLFASALLLAACAPSGDSGSQAPAGAAAKLDMSLGPNKVTADDYAHEPVPVVLRTSVESVDADGKVAPFGMASRAQRDVAAAPVAATAAVAEAGTAAVAQSAVYAAQCVACHGADAKGVQGLGLDLTASKMVADSSAADLVAFLQAGRLPDSPDSVTGIPMPAFSWMPQSDLDEVAAYLKSL